MHECKGKGYKFNIIRTMALECRLENFFAKRVSYDVTKAIPGVL